MQALLIFLKQAFCLFVAGMLRRAIESAEQSQALE